MEAMPVDFASGDADKDGQQPETEHFAAGVLKLLGVDPEDALPDVTPYAPFLV